MTSLTFDRQELMQADNLTTEIQYFLKKFVGIDTKTYQIVVSLNVRVCTINDNLLILGLKKINSQSTRGILKPNIYAGLQEWKSHYGHAAGKLFENLYLP